MPLRIRGHIKYPAKQAAPKVEVVRPSVINYWTDEEDAYLTKCYPTDGSKGVSASLGRTRGAVQARAKFLGVDGRKFSLRA